MIYKIKHRWVYNSKTTTKEEQILELEHCRIKFQVACDYLDRISMVISKMKPELKGREGEIKHIIEEFIIDVCSTNKLQ
jgi:hypothetical protein